MLMSPSSARLADTPPVVGSVITETYGSFGGRELRQRRARLGHLQQRVQAFLHARAAAGGEAHERPAVLDAIRDGAHEPLADDRAHRPGR